MAAVKFFKVTELPGEAEANALYFVKAGSRSKLYLTDGDGVPHSVSGGEADIAVIAIQAAQALGFAQFPTADSIADSFDDLTYVDVANAEGLDTSTPGVLKPDALSGGTETISDPADEEPRAYNTFGFITRGKALEPGRVVTHIGFYNPDANAKTIHLKLVRRKGPALYDFLLTKEWLCPGGGWSDCELDEPFVVPGTGLYYIGAYIPYTGSSPTLQRSTGVARNLFASNFGVGDNQSVGPDAESSVVYPMRYVYTTGSGLSVTTTELPFASEPSVLQSYVFVKEPEGAVANNDFGVRFSRDGGENWIDAPLVFVRDYPIDSDTLKLYRTNPVDVSEQEFDGSFVAFWASADVEFHSHFTRAGDAEEGVGWADGAGMSGADIEAALTSYLGSDIWKQGGGPTHASSIGFDATGTDLEADSVQDAIVEVLGKLNAQDIAYDNTESTLEAANVQEAIDVLVDIVAEMPAPSTFNLSVNASDEAVAIENSGGTGATILAATDEQAGVLSAEDKAKLDGIAEGAQVNPTPDQIVAAVDDHLGYSGWKSIQDTDLGYERDASTVTVTSSTGANTTLPAADSSNAGVMTAADRVKLNSVQSGAQVNPSNAQIISQINAGLGTTAWQGEGGGDESTNATVRVVATSNHIIANLQPEYEIDGVALEDGWLVLLVGQSNPTQNGIYIVGETPARPSQYDSFIELAGMIVTVQSGDEYGGSIWLCTSADGGEIGLDDIEFERTSVAPTNLSATPTADQVLVNSSTGASAVVPAATTSLAGVLAASDKLKLDGIEAGAQKTNITIARNVEAVEVQSSDGTNGWILAASAVAAGVMTAADKAKLATIEANATADQTPAEIVNAVNAALGSTAWQGGGAGGSGGGGIAFVASKSANQDFAHGSGSGAPAKVLFQTELSDPNNTFAPGATSRWTPGVAGAVLLTGSIRFGHAHSAAARASGEIRVYKNGSQVAGFNFTTDNASIATGAYREVTFSFSDSASATDYYEVFATIYGWTVAVGTTYHNGRVYSGSRVAGFLVGSGSAETNITITRASSQVTVNSSTGTDGVIGAADASNAGVMTAAQATKLAGIDAGAQVNPSGSDLVDAIDVELEGDGWRTGATTNLTANPGAASVELQSSTGSSATLNAATDALAGVMSASDKGKLDGIEIGAQVNLSGEETALALDTFLGSDDWRTGGGASEASAINFNPDGTELEATNVQDALVELEGKIGEGGGGASTAEDVTFDPSGTALSATDVQAAIVEIDDALSDVVSDIDDIEGKLATVEEGAQVNPTGEAMVDAIDTFLGNDSWHTASGTDLGVTPAADKVTITSSTGDDVDIPAATDEAAGVLSAEDKEKLDGIAEGAEVNPDAEAILGLLDTYLGSTDWREPLVSNETGGLAAVLRVRAATVGNVDINSALNNGDVLDGITLATGDLVLAKAQTNPAQNGIYVVGPNPVQRHVDYNSFEELPGTAVVVLQGTVNRGTFWLCDSDFGGSIGVDTVTFRKVAPAELTVSRTADKVSIVNSVGTETDIPKATTTEAGAMSAWDRYTLNFPKVITIAWTNLDLNSDITGAINGVAVAVGNTIAVAGQTNPNENGLYIVGASSATRHPDYANGASVGAFLGAKVRVLYGRDAGKTYWVGGFSPAGFIGSQPITFHDQTARVPNVRVATTGNIAINTALNPGDTIDGVELAAGDLVLVKNQTTQNQNGIYAVATSPYRPTEYSTLSGLLGTTIGVREGNVGKGSVWACTEFQTASPFNINFMRVSTAAGTPLSLDVEGQEISGGASTVPKNLGTISTGTLTFDVSARQIQKVVNDGNFLLALTAGKSGSAVLIVTNGANAGEINLSNFTRPVIPEGNELDQTEGSVFRLGIEVVDDISIVHVLKVA